MKTLLYSLVSWIADVHNKILAINDSSAAYLNDKQLHFVVIGLLGMVFFLIVYPLFKWLASKGHILLIAWIYVFTLIVVITFAIEIGQGYTGTGNMEFADIAFGIVGFLFMFAIFMAVRAIVLVIKRKINKK